MKEEGEGYFMNLTGRQADVGNTWYKNTAGMALKLVLSILASTARHFSHVYLPLLPIRWDRRGTYLHVRSFRSSEAYHVLLCLGNVYQHLLSEFLILLSVLHRD